MTRQINRNALAAFFVGLSIFLLVPGLALTQGEPFACTGEAFISQRQPSQLFRFFQNNPEAFTFEPVGPSINPLECEDPVPNDDPPPDFLPVCNLQLDGSLIEVNNLAFRSTDGLLYAVNLGPSDSPLAGNNNFGLVKIDAEANVEMVGINPPPNNGGSWPNVRLDAGDISQDGNLMFVNQGGGAANTTTFAIIDLRVDPPEVIARPMIVPAGGTNANATVNDWAYNRIDGNLYGGNRMQGRVARLNVAEFFDLNSDGDPTNDGIPPPVGDPWPTLPTTITREDFTVDGCPPGDPPEGRCDAAELPSDPSSLPSSAFGGAWLNASGTLFLYRNLCDLVNDEDPCFECGGPDPPSTCEDSGGDPDTNWNNGKLFRIDLNLDLGADPLSPPAMPQIVRTRIGRDSDGFNDSAACIRFPRFGPAKQMTATCGLPATVTLEFVVENFETSTGPPDDDLVISDISALEDLVEVFGTPDVDNSGDDDWNFVSISSVPAGFANTNFNGGDGVVADNQLIALNQSLGPQGGALPSSATITVVIEVRTLNNADVGTLPDPPPPSGSFCNQVLFTGTNFDGVTIGDLSTVGSDPDPDGNGDPDEALISCVTLATPAVTLDKTGTFEDGGDGPDVGDPINYTLTVSNPAVVGAVTLENLVVDDPLLGTIDCAGDTTPPQISTLAPGASVICTGSYGITADDFGTTVMNTATVTGTPLLPDPPFPDPFPDSCPPVVDSDNHDETIPPVTPPVRCIDLLKSCEADFGSDGVAQVGELIDFELVVSNCGEVILSNVFIDDPLVTVDCSPATNGAITLDPMESEVCTGTYVITEADIEAGVVCNVATATGVDPVGTPVTSLPAESCCELPAIEIPTLGHLGLALLALGLAGLGVRRLRRGS